MRECVDFKVATHGLPPFFVDDFDIRFSIQQSNWQMVFG